MDFGNTASVILRVFLIITILVAGVVLVALFTLLTGLFDFGVRMGHSNVFRSVTKSELAVALFAAVALATAALFALRRL